MPDELPPLPPPHDPYEPVEVPPHIDALNHELWSNGHPMGADLDGVYTATSNGDYDPRARYAGNIRHDELPHRVRVRTGPRYRGSQIHSGSYPMAHSIPIVPSLPLPEYGVPVTPVPNDAPPSRGPLLHNPVHPGVSAAEDLKRLASQYLFSPGSHVDKLRMRRSRRSGGFKVLIMLEIEDAM